MNVCLLRRHLSLEPPLGNPGYARFEIKKSWTTAYHSHAGDGIVECFNLSLLQMLCFYVNDNVEWE